MRGGGLNIFSLSLDIPLFYHLKHEYRKYTLKKKFNLHPVSVLFLMCFLSYLVVVAVWGCAGRRVVLPGKMSFLLHIKTERKCNFEFCINW